MRTITEARPDAWAKPQAAKLAAVRAVADQAARMAAELAGIEPPTTTADEWGTADEWPEASQSIEWETWPEAATAAVPGSETQ